MDNGKPKIAIEYCVGCKWLARAAWMAQEILTTFDQDVAEVALMPSSGGTFRISIGKTLVWDRKEQGGFAEASEIKRRIRDAIVPDRSLGHCELK